jgi:hypothetical protein
VRRYLRAQGLRRVPHHRHRATAGTEAAERRLAEREVRSYELAYVNALWHADFHVGSRRVLTPRDGWSDACLCSAFSMTARGSAATPSGI